MSIFGRKLVSWYNVEIRDEVVLLWGWILCWRRNHLRWAEKQNPKLIIFHVKKKKKLVLQYNVRSDVARLWWSQISCSGIRNNTVWSKQALELCYSSSQKKDVKMEWHCSTDQWPIKIVRKNVDRLETLHCNKVCSALVNLTLFFPQILHQTLTLNTEQHRSDCLLSVT